MVEWGGSGALDIGRKKDLGEDGKVVEGENNEVQGERKRNR